MSRVGYVAVHLEPGEEIQVSPPRTSASTLGDGVPVHIPFVVTIGVAVSVYADREQLVRLRDALSEALAASASAD